MPLGELTALPRPLARFQGAYFKGEGMKGREGGGGVDRIKKGKRQERRGEKEREGPRIHYA
jgi:hypothetical protein